MEHSPMASEVATLTRVYNVASVLLAGLLFGALVLTLVVSIPYGVKGDANYLHYMAYLMDVQGMVPYKDIYTVNLPGTYWCHLVFGKLFGYSSNALIAASVFCLSLLWFISYQILKPFGKVAAATGGTLFGLLYLGGGPFAGLQRDFFALVPIALTLLLVQYRSGRFRDGHAYFLIGCLFGWVFMIKPHLIIGLLVVLAYGRVLHGDDTIPVKALIPGLLINGGYALLGVIISLLMSFFWLWNLGAWPGFSEIFSHYLPLYAQLSDDWVIRNGVSKWLFKIKSLWQLKSYLFLIVAALVGVFLFVKDKNRPTVRKKAMCLLIMAGAYFLAVVIAGRVWFNYLMPLLYFVCLCTAMLLAKLTQLSSRWQIIALVLFLFSLVSVFRGPYSLFRYQYANGKLSPPEYIFYTDFELKKQEFLTYLKTNFSPEQYVQPVSFLGGTTEALFEVKANIATPYVFSLPFYHHVSEQFILDLRKNFILQLKEKMPEIIVEVPPPPMGGDDVSLDFPALHQFLDQYYRLDYSAESGFNVWRPLHSSEE